MTPPARLAAAAFLFATALVATAVPPDQIDGPVAAPGKGSAEEALLPVQLEKGLKVGVWAAEPLMMNPVAFAFDEQGRAYVAETTRFNKGVPDTRNHNYWLDEDLANRSTADLLAMYKKHKYQGFEKYTDQLRVVWDSTGKGRADKCAVFSGGYNRPQDGLAAGVLARRGSVYFACIPDLYRLKDTKGTNTADAKESLFTGFGPTVQFIGHDLHGLRMGPDGRLYFSIGDRGFVVKTKEGTELRYPNQGAVLRCEPDGSRLEVVHAGLRNPQEIAFDDLGNLFTYDNNSDSGDRARWVHVVEGGDSGWRGGYQYGTLYHPPGTPQGNRGPWNAEKIWHVPGPTGEPPAYVVPPLLHFGNGPAGMTHYPGVGLNEKYRDHFFACDFTSNSSNSVIWSVAVKPKGAGFEVAKHEPFVRGMVPTDCEFGPDGAFYWSDWTGGWNPPNKGRLYRVTDPEAMKNPAVAGAKTILAAGFEKRDTAELVKLLGHPHQQVRTEAGIELGGRGGAAILPLANAAKAGDRIARVHAVWALGMIGRQRPGDATPLTALAADPDAEVRAQVFRTLGGFPYLPHGTHAAALTKGTTDPDPRVRFFAATAFRRLDRGIVVVTPGSEAERILPLLELLKSNADADGNLRHAAVVGLAGATADGRELLAGWTAVKEKYDTPAVRLGVVLALRRHKAPQLAAFLADADPKVATEAARAVYDERVAAAGQALAALADRGSKPDPIAYRALAANYVLGTADAANRVARFAARSTEPDHQRVFALKLLADWANPPRRDPITGLTHDLPRRDPEAVAAAALRPVLAGVFSGSDAVRAEAAQVSAKLGIQEVGPLLSAVVRDAKAPPADRADALAALAAVKAPNLADLTAFARSSTEPRLKAAGLTVAAKLDPDLVRRDVPALIRAANADLPVRQAALALLAKAGETADGDAALSELLAAATAGKAPPELLLEVLEAADARAKSKAKLHAPLGKDAAAYRDAAKKSADKLAPWAETLAGGDAAKGRSVFLNNNAVYCQRCHQLDGQGGEVGPPLNGLAAQPGKDRRYLLEAIVQPSAQIAKGYETAVVTLADGRVVSGVVKEDTKKQLRLVTPENRELVIPADEIEGRRTGPSAMPDDLHPKLTRRELRDLIEFLSSLRDPLPKRGR